jgi:hypothetical protein
MFSPEKHEQIPGQKAQFCSTTRGQAVIIKNPGTSLQKNTLKPRKKQRKVLIQHSSLPKGGGPAAAGSTAAAPLAAGAGCRAG